MKPKEWLHSQGLIDKIGKGRMSLAHIELIKAEVAKGTFIEGYSKVTAVAPVTKRKNSEPKPVPTGEKVIAELAPDLYPKGMFKGIYFHNGVRKETGTATCCREHGTSIAGHHAVGETLCGVEGTNSVLDHYEGVK